MGSLNYSMTLVRRLPVNPTTVEQLRKFLLTFGMEAMMVTLVRVEGGYQFLCHARYQPKLTHCVQGEKSGQLRVFKSVQAALNLAKSFGFDQVAVEL
jgi:hypothetical protein